MANALNIAQVFQAAFGDDNTAPGFFYRVGDAAGLSSRQMMSFGRWSVDTECGAACEIAIHEAVADGRNAFDAMTAIATLVLG